MRFGNIVEAPQGQDSGDVVTLDADGYIPGTIIRLGEGLELDENGAIRLKQAAQIDLSDMEVEYIGSSGKTYEYTFTGVIIPQTVDGHVPMYILRCSATDHKGDTAYDADGYVMLNGKLPVAKEDVLKMNHMSDFAGKTLYFTVVDGSNMMLCDAVSVYVSIGGGGAGDY